MFKKFHRLITNETQLNTNTLRTYNGGEYTSQAFESYL